ncbi:MFS transporter [Streptomyces spongiae]|uniref:MFS transporter n=1 Tax=Streptomyces spongiae TaxID=565072 RepID=A0A5N8XI02_9ACTN|nr:MFS transporter [Streptomyces spongiae]MPY59113.1 MFS transporter [Streptomyces spongiae]
MPELALPPAARTPPPPASTQETRQVPAAWLALLATPVAASANGPVLILPDMADSLGVRTATATWLVTVFAWAMAVGTPLMAGLLRRRGLDGTLRLSAVLIVAGTAVVAVAPWLPLAMAGRAAQAAGGAGLITAAMSLAGSVRRMGVITAGFGTLGAAGPLLGSAIADVASWRVSLAVGAVALLALPAVLRRATPSAPRQRAPGSGQSASEGGQSTPGGGRGTPFDGRGAALLVLVATALVLVPRYPLPAVAASSALAALLALHIRSRPTGFVPASLLRTRTFVLSALLACALATSYFTLLFTVPQLLGDRTGWSTSTIGTGQLVALLAGSALSMVLAAASARMSRPRVLTILLTAGALAPLTAVLTPWAPLLLLVATLAVLATSAGQATLAVYATQAAPTALRPTAIGLFNLCYQLGGAFGPAIAALITLGG